MKRYLTIQKQVGETPLSAIEKLRETDTSLTGIPLAYAGRLDPMASGTLLVLVGEECKRQASYHSLDKEYLFEVLFGFSSDTGDVLGIAQRDTADVSLDSSSLYKAAKSLIGTHTIPYPHYSSKTVKGKPLFLWTLEGKLNEIEVPTIQATVYDIHLLDVCTQTMSDTIDHILQKIELIPQVTEESKALGRDFRRSDIRTRWNELKKGHETDHVTIAKFKIVVSSGTYIRSLAPIIAKKLGTAGLAYSIHRSKIGFFTKIPLLGGFWRRVY